MSRRSEYAPGVPCWVDLSSTDVGASARFYEEVLGWRAETIDDPAAGGYGMFLHGDRKVAGLVPAMAGQPVSTWDTFVATDDAEALADRVRQAGGTVAMKPTQVFEHGIVTVFRAPDGSFAAGWQAGDHPGAELVNEPVSFCWSELVTRDLPAAETFYPAVFGWDPRPLETPPGKYTEWHVGGHAVGGMLEMDPGYPAATPSFWMTYVAVADLDATTAAAERAGARMLVSGVDATPGRFSAFTDPHGATISIIQLHEIS
ncbi:VOC family protein [Nonomuraea sp. KM90]|uniref:VOC family protein n=1 Tax=Nonomuraea sp. KM90 TaxID=3457428 RepID=UPI003FCCF020